MCVYFENDLELVPGNERDKKLTGKAICPECKGTGLLSNAKCTECSGSGYLTARWTWTISNRKETY